MKPSDVVAILTLLVFVLHTLAVDAAASRGRCRMVRIRKGRSRMLLRGTMIKYRCRSGFTLVGIKRAICVNGEWNHKPPVCVATGCSVVVGTGTLQVTHTFDGAVLSFACDESHALKGMRVIYCNSKRWSSKPPTCIPVGSESVCDFEKGLCGWTNSDQDHFDWTVSSGKTRTRYTGPSWDHTYGDGLQTGHYLFIETSNPRRPGDAAFLWSPVFPVTYAGKCFQFWYHMFGRMAVGSLSVFVKPKDQSLSDQAPLFALTGNQGDEWRVGHVKIPSLTETFQVIIKGEKNQSVYSDIAIDDVSVLSCPQPETTSTATTAISTSMYVTSQQESQTTAEMAIKQDTSPGQTTFTTPALSTEHMSNGSTVERTTTEAETSTHVDTFDFTTHVDTLGLTTGLTTTRHLFTVIYKSTASKAQTPSTAGETTAEVLVDDTTRQTEDVVHSTIARKSATADFEAITRDKEAMRTTEQSVPRTARHPTRGEQLVTDTTQYLAESTAVMTLVTDGERLMTHTERVTPNSQTGTHTTTSHTPGLPHRDEVSFHPQAVTDNVLKTTHNPHSVSSKQTYPQSEIAVTVFRVSGPTTTEPSIPQRQPTYTTEHSVPAYTTTTERSVLVTTSDTVFANKRILDETTVSVMVDGPFTKVDSATNKRELPTLRYKHRKVSHNIPLVSSLLALAALFSIAIGVVMWVIVNRRERKRQQDQELTPIATAYTY